MAPGPTGIFRAVGLRRGPSRRTAPSVRSRAVPATPEWFMNKEQLQQLAALDKKVQDLRGYL